MNEWMNELMILYNQGDSFNPDWYEDEHSELIYNRTFGFGMVKMNQCMNEWVNEWMNGRVNEWINQWVNDWMNEWMGEGMKEWMGEWMKE